MAWAACNMHGLAVHSHLFEVTPTRSVPHLLASNVVFHFSVFLSDVVTSSLSGSLSLSTFECDVREAQARTCTASGSRPHTTAQCRTCWP